MHGSLQGINIRIASLSAHFNPFINLAKVPSLLEWRAAVVERNGSGAPRTLLSDVYLSLEGALVLRSARPERTHGQREERPSPQQPQAAGPRARGGHGGCVGTPGPVQSAPHHGLQAACEAPKRD